MDKQILIKAPTKPGKYKVKEGGKIYEVKVQDNGTKEWRLNGKLHREDGPAIEYANGEKYWYKNGQCHREDGPAVEQADGTKSWYKNGQRHREDGPAIEWADGTKYWYKNGQRHREDGPAIEWADGTKYWYLNDKYYTEAQFKAKMNKNKPASNTSTTGPKDMKLNYDLKEQRVRKLVRKMLNEELNENSIMDDIIWNIGQVISQYKNKLIKGSVTSHDVATAIMEELDYQGFEVSKVKKLKEEEKGSIKLKKGTSDSDIKKYTEKDIDVELVDEVQDEELDLDDDDLDKQARKGAKKISGKASQLDKVVSMKLALEKEMKQLAKEYKNTEGEAKAKIVTKLKQKTQQKKELEARQQELEDAMV